MLRYSVRFPDKAPRFNFDFGGHESPRGLYPYTSRSCGMNRSITFHPAKYCFVGTKHPRGIIRNDLLCWNGGLCPSTARHKNAARIEGYDGTAVNINPYVETGIMSDNAVTMCCVISSVSRIKPPVSVSISTVMSPRGGFIPTRADRAEWTDPLHFILQNIVL